MEDKSNDDLERQVIVIAQKIVESTVPPIPDNFRTPFKSIHEWLSFLCDNEQHSEPVSEYKVAFYKTPYLLASLVGYNHGMEQGIPASRIVFQPKQYMWIKLPKKIYRRLTQEQFIDQVHAELREFFITEQFKNSFMALGYNISTNFQKDIWSI